MEATESDSVSDIGWGIYYADGLLSTNQAKCPGVRIGGEGVPGNVGGQRRKKSDSNNEDIPFPKLGDPLVDKHTFWD